MQLFAQCRQMFSKGPLNKGLQCKYGEYGLPPHRGGRPYSPGHPM